VEYPYAAQLGSDMPGVALSSILLLVAPPRGFIFSPRPALPYTREALPPTPPRTQTTTNPEPGKLARSTPPANCY